jgi:hypothetical protein
MSDLASSCPTEPARRAAALVEPRVFYPRHHGDGAFFPLWSLARCRNLRRGGDPRVAHGM